MGLELLRKSSTGNCRSSGSSTPDLQLGADSSAVQAARRRALLRPPLDKVFVYHNGAESYYAAGASEVS